MSELPETILDALSDIPVDGAACLEAGAGAGNATAALRHLGADTVCAVTNDDDHASTVRDRFRDDESVVTLCGDLRTIPVPDDTFDIVTAHALFNVVTTTEISAIAAELTRVTAPGGFLVVDDYSPVPAPEVRDLFAVANAVSELDTARPTFTFYPQDMMCALFEGFGWEHTQSKTLLDPVPWTADLLDTHLDLVLEQTEDLDEPVGETLADHGRTVRHQAGESIDTGEMYSLAFKRPQ